MIYWISLLRRLFWVSAFGLTLAPLSMAAAAKNKSKDKSAPKARAANKANRSGVDPNSSEGLRSKDSFVLLAGGGLLNLNARQAVSGGYYFNGDNILEVGFAHSQFTLFGSGTEYNEFFGHFKHFLGNSFYGNIGASYIDYSSESTFAFNTNEQIEFYKVTLYNVYFAIGNRWQIGRFTIGCDWIGFGTAFMQSGEDYYFPKDELRDEKTRLDEHRKYATQLYLVNLHLGVSF